MVESRSPVRAFYGEIKHFSIDEKRDQETKIRNIWRASVVKIFVDAILYRRLNRELLYSDFRGNWGKIFPDSSA